MSDTRTFESITQSIFTKRELRNIATSLKGIWKYKEGEVTSVEEVVNCKPSDLEHRLHYDYNRENTEKLTIMTAIILANAGCTLSRKWMWYIDNEWTKFNKAFSEITDRGFKPDSRYFDEDGCYFYNSETLGYQLDKLTEIAQKENEKNCDYIIKKLTVTDTENTEKIPKVTLRIYLERRDGSAMFYKEDVDHIVALLTGRLALYDAIVYNKDGKVYMQENDSGNALEDTRVVYEYKDKEKERNKPKLDAEIDYGMPFTMPVIREMIHLSTKLFGEDLSQQQFPQITVRNLFSVSPQKLIDTVKGFKEKSFIKAARMFTEKGYDLPKSWTDYLDENGISLEEKYDDCVRNEFIEKVKSQGFIWGIICDKKKQCVVCIKIKIKTISEEDEDPNEWYAQLADCNYKKGNIGGIPVREKDTQEERSLGWGSIEYFTSRIPMEKAYRKYMKKIENL